MMENISPYQLRHYFAASGEELVKLRLLLDPDDDGNFPTPDACRALLAIRQGNRGQPTAASRSGQASPNLLQRLRRGVSRKVPPQ